MPRPALPPISADVIITLRVPREHWPALSQAVHAQTKGEPYREGDEIIVLDEFSPVSAYQHIMQKPRPKERAAHWLTNYLTHVSHLRNHATQWRFERR